MRSSIVSIFNGVIPQKAPLSFRLEENIIRIRFKNSQKILGFHDLISHGSFYFFLLHFRQPTIDVIPPGGNIWYARYRDGMRMMRMHMRVVRHTCTHTSNGVDHVHARIGSPEWHSFQTGPQEQITPILRIPAAHARDRGDRSVHRARIYNYYRSYSSVILRSTDAIRTASLE